MCIVLQSEIRSKCIDQTWYLQRSLVQQCLQHHQAAQMAWWGFWEPPTVWLYSTWKVDKQNQKWKNSIAIYLKIPSSAFKAPGPLAKRWTCCLMSKSMSLSDSQLLKLWANGLLRFPLGPLPTFPIHILVIKSSWSTILYIPSCSIEDSYPCHIFIISHLEVHPQSTQKSTKWLLHMSHLRLLIVLLAQQPQPVAALGKVRQFWVWCLLWCHLRSHQLFIDLS